MNDREQAADGGGARRASARDALGVQADRRLTWALSLAVGIVLADSAIVTLALPEILREFDVEVGAVAWVLIAYNLVLGLLAVPAAWFGAARGRAASVGAAGLVVFAVASAACALAGSLTILIAARVMQAVGGALVITAFLELLMVSTADARRGSSRWAAAGVAGTALGPVVGGVLTDLVSWQSIFIVQVPLVLVALPAVLRLRASEATGGAGDGALAGAAASTRPSTESVRSAGRLDRSQVFANLGLALLSAALTAALFLLVLLLVEGWRRSPAVAAVTVSVIPVAALAAGALARAAKAGTRGEALAGAILISGGLVALAYLPDASLGWTVAPQVLIGLGLGLTVESLTASAIGDGHTRVLHGGWTIASRHLGIVAGLLILTPIFVGALDDARRPAEESIARLVIDAPLPVSTRLDLARELADQVDETKGRVPDLAPAFAAVDVSPGDQATVATLRTAVDDQLERSATHAFKNAYLVGALLALLALGPAFLLRDEASGTPPAEDLIPAGGPSPRPLDDEPLGAKR